MSTETTAMTLKTAQREVRNLAAIKHRLERGHLNGRNNAATWATIEYKVRELQRFFAYGEYAETPETDRLYDRFNKLERWSVGLS